MIKNGFHIKTIDEVKIEGKKIIIRVDFNVSLTDKLTIADDARIRQSIPTLQLLLKDHNKLILISHLNRPEKRDPKHSLKIVSIHLQTLLPGYTVTLVDDFLTEKGKEIIARQKENEIIMLENIRFYPEEKKNENNFAQKLSNLADMYVNDAFGVSHRNDASVVGLPHFLPSYAGLLLAKEIEIIGTALKKPKKPFVVIIGGTKISTKIDLIGRLIEIADYVLIGGGLANTFLCAQEYPIGKSFCEHQEVDQAKKLLFLAAQKNTAIILPSDVVIGDPKKNQNDSEVRKIEEVPHKVSILDIGPETQAQFGSIIAKAKTIIWNGPVGYFENPLFKRGTDFIYYAVTHNTDAVSIVGGGDTLAAISKEEYLHKITHISTGGGAMLEFIEKGTLPGIEALNR